MLRSLDRDTGFGSGKDATWCCSCMHVRQRSNHPMIFEYSLEPGCLAGLALAMVSLQSLCKSATVDPGPLQQTQVRLARGQRLTLPAARTWAGWRMRAP
jgi:hypothetical protein